MDTLHVPGVNDPRLSRRRLVTAMAAATAAASVGELRPTFARAMARQATPIPPGPWAESASIPVTLSEGASSRFQAVVDALKGAMVKHGIPGTALGILMDGKEEHAALGVADLERNEPVTLDTRFQIGSLTKPYTATAVMRLVAQGKIDLYAPVRTYLLDFNLLDEDVAARATIWNLLTHTGGWWGDILIETGDGDDALARFIQEVMPTLPQYQPLGAMFSYNNTCFTLLGRIIEVVEGRPYRAAIGKLLLDPLGMTASTFDLAEVEQGAYSLGYANLQRGTVLQSPLVLPRSVEPAGNLWSTTHEQLRWARLQITRGAAPDGTRLLPEHTIELMQTAQMPYPGTPVLAMGLTWFLQEIGGIRFVMHSGDTVGQHTSFLIAPDEGFAIVMLTNSQPGGAAAEGAVFTAAMQGYLGLEEDAVGVGFNAALTNLPDATPLALTPDELSAYAGRFEDPSGGVIVQVENDQLLATWESFDLPGQLAPAVSDPLPADVPVSISAGDQLAAGGKKIGAYVRKPNGDIGWLHMGARAIPLASAG